MLPEDIFKLFLFFALFLITIIQFIKVEAFAMTFMHNKYTSDPTALLTFGTCCLSSTKLNEGIAFGKFHKKRWIDREEQHYTNCPQRCVTSDLTGDGTHGSAQVTLGK